MTPEARVPSAAPSRDLEVKRLTELLAASLWQRGAIEGRNRLGHDTRLQADLE